LAQDVPQASVETQDQRERLEPKCRRIHEWGGGGRTKGSHLDAPLNLKRSKRIIISRFASEVAPVGHREAAFAKSTPAVRDFNAVRNKLAKAKQAKAMLGKYKAVVFFHWARFPRNGFALVYG